MKRVETITSYCAINEYYASADSSVWTRMEFIDNGPDSGYAHRYETRTVVFDVTSFSCADLLSQFGERLSEIYGEWGDLTPRAFACAVLDELGDASDDVGIAGHNKRTVLRAGRAAARCYA